MMRISQGCQYALRAVFELAKRLGDTPVSVVEISEAQAIPSAFLEQLFRKLRASGVIESRRGRGGGYWLAVKPRELPVGEIIRLIDGPVNQVRCNGGRDGGNCPFVGNCSFIGLWQRADQALADVYDSTSFQDLIEDEKARLARQTGKGRAKHKRRRSTTIAQA